MKINLLVLAAFLFASIGTFAQKFENLAPTPPMGWNSWNAFYCDINETGIIEVVDAFVELGFKDAGYEYIVIDDCWQVDRDENGNIVADKERFPSGIKALADYVHSKGLKFGLYSDAGTTTCAGRPGSLGHEYQDARTYAEWGVDFLKYDWCSTENQIAIDDYRLMRDALYQAGRPVLFSICEWGKNQSWKWAGEFGHMWRVTYDIHPEWIKDGGNLGVVEILDLVNERKVAQYAKPNAWNDPDMLHVGNGNLTFVENRTHFSLWCMMAAPLMMGTDLRKINKEILEILTNKEMIAIDQDPKGIQGTLIKDMGETQIYCKPLSPSADGKQRDAYFLLNRADNTRNIEIQFNEDVLLRDVWAKKDIKELKNNLYQADVASHDCIVLIATKKK